MKKIRLFFYLLQVVFIGGLQSQNLVPNPSFENYTTCPTSVAQINLALPWVTPSSGSPDYFNSCATSTFCDVPSNFFGIQTPRTGNAYAQVVIYPSSISLREYAQIKLLSPLIAGQTYNISFYTSLQENSYRASNNIGIYISTPAPSIAGSGPLPVTPQINETAVINDVINWTLISGTYTAIGGEEYITIGNFYDDVSTTTAINPSGTAMYATFYLIEDVCVTPQGGTGCNAPLPIELLNFYGENKEYYNHLYWTTSTEINNDYFTLERSSDAFLFDSIGKIKGAGNSSVELFYEFEDDNILNGINYYRLKQTDFNGKYSYSNTIALNSKFNGVGIYPNPFNNEFEISFYDALFFPINISVYNLTGQVIWSQVINNNTALKVSLKNQPKGMYLVKIEDPQTVYFYKQLKN